MRLFKLTTFFIGATLLATLMGSPALAQSGGEKTKVQQHNRGVMIQMSQPSRLDSDSTAFRVLKSDSAAGKINLKALKRRGKMGKVKMRKELSYDPRAMVRRRTQQAMPDYTAPPVAIRTRAGQDSRIVVYVKNRTDNPLKDLSVQPDRLPDKWSSQPADRSISLLPAGHQQTVTFSLQAPSTQPKYVGFQLKTADGLSINWAARVVLPETAAGKTQAPASFEVHGNYPNPFNPTTTIRYSLPQTMEVQLTVYNIIGQKVATLVNGTQQAGVQNVTWDASRIASGTYLYRVVAKAPGGKRFVSERTMVLIK